EPQHPQEFYVNANLNRPASEGGNVYKATIIDQLLARSPRGELQLVLTVKITAKLRDGKKPSEGHDECPPQEQEVLITFAEDKGRLHMALRDLERLGFSDSDVSKLHPDHDEFVSFVGREVHVRQRWHNDLPYWNFVWPREVLAGGEFESEAAALC